jgi:Glycosyltransferase family 17.
MYFDEDIVLDIRLNTLDKFVDYFVIVESRFTHSGAIKELKFDINKFKKFENKIIYLIFDDVPNEVKNIDINEDKEESVKIQIMNAFYRETYQRNYISKGLDKALDNDVIMISDIDEIPKLDNVDLSISNKKIIMFQQEMYYYKLNLKLPNVKWVGTKACKLKNFKTPQWLRNIKDRKYKFFRIDTLFSDKKYRNIKILNDGGWHFTNIKTPDQLAYKLKSYLHHTEFDKKFFKISDIKNIMKNKKAIYDLKADQRIDKVGEGPSLVKTELITLPKYSFR